MRRVFQAVCMGLFCLLLGVIALGVLIPVFVGPFFDYWPAAIAAAIVAVIWTVVWGAMDWMEHR